MDFKEIKINWQKIDIPWIYFTNVNWRKLSVSENSKNIDWTHSRIVSPTYARVRIITIEWIVDKLWDTDFSAEKIYHLQNIFALQTDLSELEEKEVYIKDIFWNEWKILVKIKEPFDFEEADQNLVWSHWKFRVVLESTKSPIYKSFEENFIFWNNWDFWGFNLDFELGKAFDEENWIMQINVLWSVAIPLRFEILAKDRVKAPLTIRNIKNWEFFKIENIEDLQAGDVLLIDTENFLVLKNWENIIEKRAPGSTWLTAQWSSSFLITDNSWIWDKFDTKVYFSNSML